jgi:ATP-dependent Clp protease ATP-binding subunit ClpA
MTAARKLKMAPRLATERDIAATFNSLLAGQPNVAKTILPYVEMFEAGLSPEGRPAGVFLLLGPTGTGKTRSVEALAESLHGSSRHILRIDCGEYQMDHEVAKFVGAPPGYLGHRETQPLFSQARINSVASERSPLSILLFDEIEKAAPSMMRMLLGVLDRGILRLGDNNLVNLERTMIFMTSNLGADKMQKELTPTLGFSALAASEKGPGSSRLESIGLAAAKRKFSPEFMNRIDATIAYQPLDDKALNQILDLQLERIQHHINVRLGSRAFEIEVSPKLKKFLLENGTSPEYGARELKRTIQRFILQPLSKVIIRGQIPPGSQVELDLKNKKTVLFSITAEEEKFMEELEG